MNTLGLCVFFNAQAAPDIQLNAILGKKIIATIDGGEQHTLTEGEVTDGGLKLVEVNRRYAVFEWEGHEIRLEPSSRIATTYAAREVDSIRVIRDASGHYFVRGEINGRSTRLLVDTGATAVALGVQAAEKMGIDWKNAPAQYVNTAGGLVTARQVYLNQMTVEGITVYNVEASINPQLNSISLLGMSFLRHFDMSESDNVLTLKKKF